MSDGPDYHSQMEPGHAPQAAREDDGPDYVVEAKLCVVQDVQGGRVRVYGSERGYHSVEPSHTKKSGPFKRAVAEAAALELLKKEDVFEVRICELTPGESIY